MSEEHIEGRNPVLEALKSGRPLHKITVARGAHGSQIQTLINLAREKNIPLQFAERDTLDRLSVTGMHQGVIALAAPLAYHTLDDLFAKAEEAAEEPLFLLLDEVEDPRNLGSIIRSAEAAGAHGVIIPERRSAGLTATVLRSSAGAANHLPVARVKNTVRAMEELKTKGCWLMGADMEGTVLWEERFDLTAPVCLVLGGEGKGLSRLVRKNCDLIVKIPMRGHVDSLNVSVAAGVLLFEVIRRRLENKG